MSIIGDLNWPHRY